MARKSVYLVDFGNIWTFITIVKPVSKCIILACAPFMAVVVPPHAAYAQSASAKNTTDLQNALRRIARNSNDSSALADAGLAALEMGDTRAAIGFLAKADQIYPRSGRVKAGLARALLAEENPFGALRYFEEALANGIALRDIASDRGLCFDLIGRNAEAQKDYELALRYGQSDELLSRYAISLGISGNVEQADAKLNPLLQKSDRDAWRNRAFIFAMNGDKKQANSIAKQTMPRKLARAIRPFFDRMPKLTAAQKAAAVHFGHFPASENIGVDVASVRLASSTAMRGGDGADAGLIPLGKPLGEDVEKPRVLAMPDTSPRRRPGAGRNVLNSPVDQKVPPKSKPVVLATNQLPEPSHSAARAKPASAKPVEARPQTKPPAKKSGLAAASKENGPARTRPAEQAPGFETVLGLPNDRKSTNVAITDTTKAEDNVPAATQKPLVSASVTRKVKIGNIEPPATDKAGVPASSSGTADQGKPTELAAFDLAKTVPAPPPTSILVESAPANRPLADIIGSIDIPEEERKTGVVPVDLDSITPAKPKPKVEKKNSEPEPEPKKVEPAHPKRYWVQIATGSNMNALKYDYRRMAKKHGKLFAGQSGWTSPWGRTRRLVVGPFDNLGAAKKFESGFRKGGGDGFAWVSAKGAEVNKLTK